MSTPVIDPTTAHCRRCVAVPGQRCVTSAGWPCSAHAVRRRDALAVAAHADPALDAVFPQHGPCLLCGVKGLGARHRRVDAIAGSLSAGEDPEVCAEEYGVMVEQVQVVARWMERWAGAWL